MIACPIRKLNLEDLQRKTNIVDGVRILNKPLFDKLVSDVKKDHVEKYGLNRKDLPFISKGQIKDTNPNNTLETRLSNNRYSEFYEVNEDYYKELQKLADTKEAYNLTFEDVESLYEDELGQDPSLDDARAEQEFLNLLDKPEDKGGITQFCSR